jgi:hypothetical protein
MGVWDRVNDPGTATRSTLHVELVPVERSIEVMVGQPRETPETCSTASRPSRAAGLTPVIHPVAAMLGILSEVRMLAYLLGEGRPKSAPTVGPSGTDRTADASA